MTRQLLTEATEEVAPTAIGRDWDDYDIRMGAILKTY